MDIEFDFKGDPVCGIASKCKFEPHILYILHNITCTHVLLNSAYILNRSARKGKVRYVT